MIDIITSYATNSSSFKIFSGTYDNDLNNILIRIRFSQEIRHIRYLHDFSTQFNSFFITLLTYCFAAQVLLVTYRINLGPECNLLNLIDRHFIISSYYQV